MPSLSVRVLSTTRLLTTILLITTSLGLTHHVGSGKPAEFSDIVKLIEAQFRVKHKGIPALAKLPLKIAGRFRRFAEVGSLKLAIFEDQDFSSPAGTVDFVTKLRGKLEPEWQSLVEVRSGQERSQTHIYVTEAGSLFKVLVIQVGRRDAVAIQVSVTPENLGKLLKDPQSMGSTLADDAMSNDEPL